MWNDTYYDLSDIFKPTENCLIICGAGISIDPPSNIPTAVTFLDTFNRLFVIQSEFNTIKNQPLLKFEKVVRYVNEFVDKNHIWMQFFDMMCYANHNHFFLAKHILYGNHVITMNFDYLIEIALIFRSGSVLRIRPKTSVESIPPLRDIVRFFAEPSLV